MKSEAEAVIRSTFKKLKEQRLIYAVESNRESTDLDSIYFFPMFSLILTATQLGKLLERTKNKKDKKLFEKLYSQLSKALPLFTCIYDGNCEYYKDLDSYINIERKCAISLIVSIDITLSNFDTEFTLNLQCNLQQLRKFINYETGTAI